MPQYLISQAPGKVVLRNYEGYITTYDEPLDYDPHAIDYLDRQAAHRSEAGQAGVSGLLDGRVSALKPEGFDEIHRRDGIQHRLNANEQKWQRFHMGEALGAEAQAAQPGNGHALGDKPNGKHNGNGNGHGKRRDGQSHPHGEA